MIKFILQHFSVALVIVLALGTAASAQPDNGGPGPVTSPTNVPLDGGASLLLAGGVAYGLRHLRKRTPKA